MNNCAKYNPYVHTSNTSGDYYLTSGSSNVVTCSICGMCFSDHIPATHPCSPWRKFPEYKPEEGQLVFIADKDRTNIQVSAIYTDNKFQVCDSNGEICASFGSDPPEYWMPRAELPEEDNNG